MGETVIEKIIHHNTGKQVKPGDIATVSVDRVMIHDIFIPFVAEKFEEMGFQKLWDPDKVVLIYDHLVPASQLDDTRHFHIGRCFCRKIRHDSCTQKRWYLPSADDGSRLCKTGRRGLRYGQPYHDLRLCRCFFFRYRLYRDGKYSGNRKHVDHVCRKRSKSSSMENCRKMSCPRM